MKHTDIVSALAQVVGMLTGQHPNSVLHHHGGDYTESRSRIPRKRKVRSSAPEARAQESRRSYQRIHTRKSRLIVRLCDQIAQLLVGEPGFVGSIPSMMSCFHQVFASRVLLMRGFRNEARGVARLALGRAKSHDDSSLVLQCLDLLRELDSDSYSGKRRRQSDHEWQYWTEADHDRRIVDSMIDDILVRRRFLHDEPIRRDIIAARENIAEIRKLRPSSYLTDCDRALQIRLLELEGKHQDVLRITSRERAPSLRKQSVGMRWLQFWTSLAKLRSMLVVGETNAVCAAIAAIDRKQIPRPHLEHELNRLEIIAYMRTQQWELASHRLSDAELRISHCCDDLERQRILLLKAYLNISNILGMHDVRVHVPRITTLLNTLDLVLLDKKGLGVMARIYEVLHYMVSGNDELAERKVLNLQVYSTRNLRYGGSPVIRQLITGLQMMIMQKMVFLNDPRKVERLLSRISDEGANVQEQMLCPIQLELLTKALIAFMRTRAVYTSV